MWCFGAPVIITLLWYTSLCASQTLELCDAPIKDDVCVLQCLTSDLSQSVVFKKDNTEYASCKYILGTLSCTSIYPTRSLISQQSSPAITFLNITQLSRAGDQGSWTCDFGSSGSSAQTLTVQTAPTQLSSPDEVNHDFCINSTSLDVTLIVTCSTQTDAKVELTSHTTGNVVYTDTPTTSKGAACSDVAENIYTAVHTITTGTGGITAGNYTVTLKAQLPGGIGEEYSVFAGYVFFGLCDPTVPTPCTCTVTIVLGFVLGLFLTPLFIIMPWVVLAKCLKIDVVKYFVGANVKCILTVVVCTLLSCTFGGLFTFVAINRHDKGDEETGCSCMVYSGILLALWFSSVMTVVYYCITNCLTDKPKGSKSDRLCFGLCQQCLNKNNVKSIGSEYSREEPEGKEEEKPVISRLAFQTERTPPREQQMGYNNKTKIKQRTNKVSPKKTNHDQNRRMCSILCEVCRPDDYYTIPENHLGIEVCSALCEVCMSKFENHSAIFENVTETRKEPSHSSNVPANRLLPLIPAGQFPKIESNTETETGVTKITTKKGKKKKRVSSDEQKQEEEINFAKTFVNEMNKSDEHVKQKKKRKKKNRSDVIGLDGDRIE